MKTKECPLCEEELVSELSPGCISELSPGCMMCGMSVDDGKFCSMKCEKMYEDIHKND